MSLHFLNLLDTDKGRTETSACYICYMSVCFALGGGTNYMTTCKELQSLNRPLPFAGNLPLELEAAILAYF